MLKRHLFIRIIWIVVLVFWALPALAEIIVDTAWARRHDAPGYEEETPWDIAVDISGNVYVTGNSWSSGTDYDCVTIKYYPNGDTAWVRTYNGVANGGDWVDAIAVDDSGSVYVIGGVWGSETSDDYATIKYHQNGDTAWVRKYNGSGNSHDYSFDLALDDSGNVYVTGQSVGAGTNWDYATIKYHPNGDTAWARRYNGSGNGDDQANALAVDEAGNVYVTGGGWDSETCGNYVTIKYSPNGDTAWVREYNGPKDSTDYAHDLAIDDAGGVYVTGRSYGTGTGYDYATVKYHPNGDTAWTRRYNGPGDSTDYGNTISVDGSGNVYVTGSSYGSGTGWDYATIKYYPDGDVAWVRRYNGSGNDRDWSQALAVDDSGNAYVTGSSSATGTAYDYATIRYYPNGDTAWLRRYNGPGNGYDRAIAIATDGYRNVYVTGNSEGSATGYDYATIKYFQALRGDPNRDWIIELGDVVYLLSYLYKGGPAPKYMATGDCNCDEIIELGDVIFLMNYLFRGGPPPDCL